MTATAAAALAPATKGAVNPALRNIGGAPAGFPIRSARNGGREWQPDGFIEHCRTLGLGVVQTSLPKTVDAASLAAMRRKVESYGMRLILDVGFPRKADDLAGFEARVKAAKEAGAESLHAAMTGRRYEDFDTLAAFRESFAQNQKSIEWAEPILRRHKLALGIENHKGWRSAEQAAWLRRVSSEWVGVHFDFGNNLSLCEDPADTLANLAPFTLACHIKDMAVEMYEDGFLLSEVPLGDGMLDIPAMVAALRKKDPRMAFDLEIITRDPLRIPVFTRKYWATFDDSFSPLPGRDLARTLDLVRKNPPKQPLPRTTGLDADARLRLEDELIAKSIRYAAEKLN